MPIIYGQILVPEVWWDKFKAICTEQGFQVQGKSTGDGYRLVKGIRVSDAEVILKQIQ